MLYHSLKKTSGRESDKIISLRHQNNLRRIIKKGFIVMSDISSSENLKTEETDTVSVKKYVAIYATIYLLLSSIPAVREFIYGVMGGIYFAVLIASAMPAVYAFTRQHRRLFKKIEYRRILLASIFIDVVWQSLGLAFVFNTLTTKMSIPEIICVFTLVIGADAFVLALLYSSYWVSLWFRIKHHAG